MIAERAQRGFVVGPTLAYANPGFEEDLAVEQVLHLLARALADLALNMTNASGTEGAAILSTRQRGRIVFFSMATSFQAAALGAEGLGRDVEMLIGNGYLEGWVDETFRLVRAHPKLRQAFAARA